MRHTPEQVEISKGNVCRLQTLPLVLLDYAGFAIGIFAAFSIFSMKIPYPVVGSVIST